MQLIILRVLLMIGLISEGLGTDEPVPAKHSSADTSHAGYVVLVPTGKSEHGLPVLRLMDSDDLRMMTLDTVFHRTFVSEMVKVNQLVGNFLQNKGLTGRTEPAYLLISGRQGGFPMKGFFLSSDGRMEDKSGIPYVELASVEARYQALSSITQIYPHELSHILYEQLAQTDPSAVESFSTDIHYFSLATDYFKAFNEGYAESFENLSRDNETNTSVTRGTRESVERYERILPQRTRGFDRDFRWPARAGFYRISMVIWYQQLENYKRYIWAVNGYSRYRAADFSAFSKEKTIEYRNACVFPDMASKLTPAQAASTEGVISSFFTKLRESPVASRYEDRQFYLPFISDTSVFISPLLRFSPLENQLLKEFFVINKYLKSLPPGQSPFLAFINGYISEFQGERETVLGIYKGVTGRVFTGNTPPELWIVNREHPHNTWLMAQFGGTAIPFYTFNLNTAGWMDLATIKGVSQDDGKRIVAYRDSVGYFKDFTELKMIGGLKPGTTERLIAARPGPSGIRSLDTEGINMLAGLLEGIVKRILITGLAISILTSLALYLLFMRDNQGWKRLLLMWVRTFFKVLLFLVVCLMPFVFQLNPFTVVLPFTLAILLVGWLRTRTRPGKRWIILFSTGMIALILCYSLL